MGRRGQPVLNQAQPRAFVPTKIPPRQQNGPASTGIKAEPLTAVSTRGGETPAVKKTTGETASGFSHLIHDRLFKFKPVAQIVFGNARRPQPLFQQIEGSDLGLALSSRARGLFVGADKLRISEAARGPYSPLKRTASILRTQKARTTARRTYRCCRTRTAWRMRRRRRRYRAARSIAGPRSCAAT